jgi:hypothetical protein
MIDDTTSRLFARFAQHDSTEESMRLVWSYLKQYGRPVAFYTDKASHFQTAERRQRDEPGVEKEAVEIAARKDRARVTGTGSHPDCGARLKEGFYLLGDGHFYFPLTLWLAA